MANNFIYPGDTIGIINNDVNSFNLITEAKKNGLKVGMYTDNADNQFDSIADFVINASLKDKKQLKEFAEKCDVVTYNSLRTDAELINFIAQFTRVPQGTDILEIMNDRLIEQAFLDGLNVNTLPYVTIVELADLYKSIDSIGYPAMLRPIQKTFFNDQRLIIHNQVDIAKASIMLDRGTYILEPYIEHEFEYDLSIINGMKDDPKLLPLVQCGYKGKQLFSATNITNLSPIVTNEMNRIGRLVSKNLNYFGAFKIKFLVNSSDTIYIQSIECKLDIDAMIFDRSFESVTQGHLRAICGLPTFPEVDEKTFYLRTFTQNQLSEIKRQWALKPNWQFVFYTKGENEHGVIGHILVPTTSLYQAIEQVDNSDIWF
ncbi:ATP-grasp domain-containing protein [Lactobacillus sp. Sy-1]|uniref:ATP-grasp domain-containing protein n=1 Tax=Lactobacillus sp. Sy-1 TaxID=2109645 RepID=UPI001C5602BE|nr:ATP-grasp domain-containing protein [Lactobacillus sp. Sy-1]MBW1605356.1 ATP-grasp domain-containing protein [Lactobacillus sp. Sy-1]